MGFTNQFLADGGAEFLSGLKWLIVVLVSIAGSFCVIYAVYIGYLFATATDDGKRRAAKNRLIKVVSSGLIIVGLALCMNAIDVTFSSPVTENNNNEDDPFSGLEQVSAPFGYKTDTDPDNAIKIEQNKDVEFVVYIDRICKGTNKSSFNSALLEDVNSFTFVDLNDSNLDNQYKGKDSFWFDKNEKKLTYKYQPKVTDGSTITIPYYTCDGDNSLYGKYWKANVEIKYNNVPRYVECYFRIDNGKNFKWGNKIGSFVLYE